MLKFTQLQSLQHFVVCILFLRSASARIWTLRSVPNFVVGQSIHLIRKKTKVRAGAGMCGRLWVPVEEFLIIFRH